MRLQGGVLGTLFSLFVAVSATAAGTSGKAGGNFNPKSIARYEAVVPGIFRGGRPTLADLAGIVQSDGIRTDIDLENNMKFVSPESTEASKLGIQFLSTPLDGNLTPSDQDVNTVLAELKDTRNYPIFVHCHYGEDRTGLLIGLYRVEVQGWTADQAYQEMLQNGFHPSLHGLDNYFRKRTGYNK